MWDLEWGHQLEFLKSMARRGKKVQALEERPNLGIGYLVLYEHFQRLSAARKRGRDGPDPIDIPSIDVYNCRIAKLDFDFFLSVIQIMDAMYLNHVYGKKEKLI